MKSYDVLVSRENGFWVGVVDGVRGGATEARRLSNLEGEVRDLISGLLDVEPDNLEFNFQLAPALPRSAIKQLEEYRTAQERYEWEKHRRDEALRNAVVELHDSEVSLRDAGHMLGLSFQRVQQIIHETTEL